MPLASLAGLLLGACDFTPRPTGVYADRSGAEYRLTRGPAALSVSGPSELCLMFWDLEDPPSNRKVIELRGQSCSNRQFGDLDWTARYVPSQLDEVQVVPPSAGRPIILVRQEER